MVNTLSGNSDSVVPVPEIDTTVACRSSYSKVFTSGDSFQDLCCELIGVGQNCPVQKPPLSLTFCGKWFATPQTLTFAVTLPCTITFRCSSLPDCWQWTYWSFKCHFLLQNLLYSQQSLPFPSSYVSGFPWLSKKWKVWRKSQKQQNF